MLDKHLARLLEIAGAASGNGGLSSTNVPHEELADLLNARDGFFAFESALEVFPVTSSSRSYVLSEWNEKSLWKGAYKTLAPSGICFAQDIFGMQFVLSDKVRTFDPETGQLADMANSISEWAAKLLRHYDELTGYPLAHGWQERHGLLAPRTRLVPITPFVLGGAFSVSNLFAMEAARAMRLRGDLANQLKDLPDGAQITYCVTD